MPASSSKFGAIDLNLLVVFDAVMQDRSITRSGKRLGLSQPAISHALSRLRHMLKDELFVRTPKGMVPTPRAEQLAAPIRSALAGFQHALEPTEFVPATATQPFRIAVDNYAAIVIVGALVSALDKIAPNLRMDFRPSGTLDIADLLDRGEIDLAIGSHVDLGERFTRQMLLRDEFVVVLRESHPAASMRDLSIENFASMRHLEISSTHYAADFVDEALAKRRLQRRIALRAPFLSAVRILISCDVVSILTRRIAEQLVRYRPLVIRQLPFASPSVEIAMIWPRWLHGLPAHRWLRDNLAGIAARPE